MSGKRFLKKRDKNRKNISCPSNSMNEKERYERILRFSFYDRENVWLRKWVDGFLVVWDYNTEKLVFIITHHSKFVCFLSRSINTFGSICENIFECLGAFRAFVENVSVCILIELRSSSHCNFLAIINYSMKRSIQLALGHA